MPPLHRRAITNRYREKGNIEMPEKAPARKHTASYSRDRKKGGYLIRVVGEYPDQFAGREVPVTLKNGSEHPETLDSLVWTGPEKDVETGEETGRRVALYKFTPKPRDIDQTELDF